jgi:hypothetical protein
MEFSATRSWSIRTGRALIGDRTAAWRTATGHDARVRRGLRRPRLVSSVKATRISTAKTLTRAKTYGMRAGSTRTPGLRKADCRPVECQARMFPSLHARPAGSADSLRVGSGPATQPPHHQRSCQNNNVTQHRGVTRLLTWPCKKSPARWPGQGVLRLRAVEYANN